MTWRWEGSSFPLDARQQRAPCDVPCSRLRFAWAKGDRLNVGVRTAACAALFLAAANCLAQVDGCRELGKAQSEETLPHLRRAFRDTGIYPIERIDVSPGRDCGDAIYFLFEVKLVYRPVGLGWIVSQDKRTGRVTIQQGI